jgi:DNA gyrase inhibitor GyrI
MVVPEMRFTRSRRLIVVSLFRKGSYSGTGEAMSKLKHWMDSKGMEPAGPPFCLFYDNPTETPEAELRSEACIPVVEPFESEGEFVMKDLPEVEVAETRHEGPPEKFAMTYGPFLEGLLNQGYRIVGPAREYFKTVSDVKGPGSGFLIQQPIARK